MKSTILALSLAVFSFTAQASDDCSSHAGFVDVSNLSIPASIEPETTVQLNGELLNDMASGQQLNESQNEVLSKIHCINVVEYETASGALGSAGERVSALAKQLQADGWASFMNMTSDGERVVILYKKGTDNSIKGFLVMAFESNESEDSLTFVNVVGGFMMSDLGNMMQNMNGLNLEELGVPGPKDN